MPEEQQKMRVALPNARRLTTNVDEKGMCSFIFEERFDYLPPEHYDRAIRATMDAMQALAAASDAVEVFQDKGWVGVRGVLPKQIVADMAVGEFLGESRLGQLSMADMLATITAVALGGIHPHDVARALSPEEGMESFKEAPK